MSEQESNQAKSGPLKSAAELAMSAIRSRRGSHVENKDTYSYDEFPQPLRVQVVHIGDELVLCRMYE